MMRALRPGDPQLIGPYRLRARLGIGGMGQVFLGLSPGGQPAAVKVIRVELAADPEFLERFRREVAVARKVGGRYTAPVIDADLDSRTPWLATAYVAGPSLADAVSRDQPLPAGSVLQLAAGLAEGLGAIHAAGVVHRDLKPANVLLADDGPRVIDFGISRAYGATPLTHTGLVVGSPGFMSPEQAEGREVGPASDIFSLGAVLAFAATGQGPFGASSTPALLYRVVHKPASLDHVPAEVRPLVERCLAKDPRQRPAPREVLAWTARPAAGRLAETVTRALATGPAAGAGRGTSGVAPTVTTPVALRGDRPPQRRRRRPLAAAAIIAGLFSAGVTAGFAATSGSHPSRAVQSARQVEPAQTVAPPATAGYLPPSGRTSSAAAPSSSANAAAGY